MIPRDAAKRSGFAVLDGSGDGREAQISKLRALLPGAIAEDGRVDATAIQNIIGKEHVSDGSQRYELRFAGKGIANYLADSPTAKELKTEPGQSKDFDATSNVVIRGDNLDVLKILRKNYYGSIKVIYIDPPYNTVKNAFIYKDDFKMSDAELIEELGLDQETVDRFHDLYGTRTHSGWLAFMYPRLKLARELLAEDGMIFISIDDHEQPNLRIICDETFGEDNFLGCIVWDLGTGTTAGHFIRSHEYVLAYAKNKNHLNNFVHMGTDDVILHGALKKISQKNPASNITFPKGMEYEGEDAIFVGEVGNSEKIHIMDSELVFRNGKLSQDTTLKAGWAMRNQILSWITGKETFDSKGQKITKFFFNKNGILTYKKERTKINPRTVLRDLASTKKGTARITNLFGTNVFPYPKPTELIKYLISLVAYENDTVVDFFAGSGTTGEAVMKLNAEDGRNRKYILVQWDEKIEESEESEAAIKYCKDNGLDRVVSSITVERLKLAGNMIKKEHPDTDTGYKVFSLKPKPQIAPDGSQGILLSAQYTERSASDTLFNMLCATGKPLDTRIRTVVEGKLYEAGGELYVLGDADLAGHEGKFNVDGWGEDNSLEQYLNLPANGVEIVY